MYAFTFKLVKLEGHTKKRGCAGSGPVEGVADPQAGDGQAPNGRQAGVPDSRAVEIQQPEGRVARRNLSFYRKP